MFIRLARYVLVVLIISLLGTNATALVNCPLGDPAETNGHRRLALIVGVGKYKDSRYDLDGPPNDANRLYDLFTGKNGYGFPKENVCMLLDADATVAQFKQMFDVALVNRARENDVAVLFYAGHGSQTTDLNGDEPDEMDETFVFHDSRTGGVKDLPDDEFNKMLARLHEKTEHITVILDSCNSGSASRGDAGTATSRFLEPVRVDTRTAPDSGASGAAALGDGGAAWAPEAMPGLVMFTAATDGTSALEIGGAGIFTDALLQVLSRVGNEPLTYAQAARQAPLLMSANSSQIPHFHGDLTKPVFGNKARIQPVGWEVIAVDGSTVQLGGPPLPGMGTGAELRVYAGSAIGADTRDPGKARATVIVDSMTGLNATASVTASRPVAGTTAPGDLAVLVRPANEFLTIKARLRPFDEPGGISRARAKKLRSMIKADKESAMLVEPTEGAGDFELSVANNGKLQLRGPENTIRATYERDRAVVENLWQQARQRALLQLQGEGGADFVDNETLGVSLVSASKQPPCADGVWRPADPNTEQIIPLCHRWNIRVKSNASVPLLVGGVILSTDGSIFGFPVDGRREVVGPGQTTTFNARNETFRGAPPLDVSDRIIVFGTQETNPVAWHLLTQTAQIRAGEEQPKSALHRALDRYLQPGTRGVAVSEDESEDSTWTLSAMTMRVEANTRFLQADNASSAPKQREYTIKNFDIRPYMPDNKETALHKVLQKADELAKASPKDGYGYKQHAWDTGSDEANLKFGIDCSRSIWFAFTRAGLAYNRNDRYIATADMVTDNTLMRDEFESCSNDTPRLGDVLVYRDDNRGDGHVVMVIDPRKRIAWGSHGWDGSARELKVEPDTGVEYQLIKYKKDWQRWDRSTMERRACWRYRKFVAEARAPGGQPGTAALASVCNSKKQCGLP
ncbi:MAG: caspase family protein [Gammaproteobacteria bacterium]